MTGPDPLLSAGTVQCITDDCGAVSFPTDAVWVGGQILVSFPAACKHTIPAVWLVTPGQDDEDGTCGASTRSGRACRRRTSGRACHQHRAQARRRC